MLPFENEQSLSDGETLRLSAFTRFVLASLDTTCIFSYLTPTWHQFLSQRQCPADGDVGSVVQSKTFVPTGSSGAHDVQIKQNKSFPLGCHCGRLNMINCPPGCLSSEQNMANSLFSPVPLIRPATARRQHSTNMYQCNKTTECNVTARENMNSLCAYAMNI